MFTSCSPAWVRFVEDAPPRTDPAPEHLQVAVSRWPARSSRSSTRPTPASATGASSWSRSCPAPPRRPKPRSRTGVDFVLTTRELDALWRRFGVDLARFTAGVPLDPPFARASGAARLFAGSGGVMEAAVRTAHKLATGAELDGGPRVNEARGNEGVRQFTVAAGRHRAEPGRGQRSRQPAGALDELLGGDPAVHFVEVMSCPSGCVGGGGQPYGANPDDVKRTARAPLRRRPALLAAPRPREHRGAGALRGVLGRPFGDRSHRLLHRDVRRPPRGGRRAPLLTGVIMGGTIIKTIKQNCRRCYTCVRDCPAKAIRIEDGQSFVVDERCIACGNCTLVCSQDAKAYLSGIEQALALLDRSRHEGGRPARTVVPGGLRRAGRAGRRRLQGGRLRLRRRGRPGRRPGEPRLQGVPRSQPHRAAHRHRLPGGERVRAQVPSRAHRLPRADRLAHDRHRHGGQGALRRRRELRLRRALRRQEGRGPRRRRAARDRRGAHHPGGPQGARHARRRPGHGRAGALGRARRRTGRASFRCPAACSRAPASTAACSTPTCSWSPVRTTPSRCSTA